jgi:hypothetical protein
LSIAVIIKRGGHEIPSISMMMWYEYQSAWVGCTMLEECFVLGVIEREGATQLMLGYL